MKIRVKNNRAVLVALSAVLLASCAARPPVREVIFEDQMTLVQMRSIQTRTFELTDRLKAMRAVIATLQDLDFVIDRADSRLGIVTATKLKGYHLHITVKVDDRRSGPLLVRVHLSVSFTNAASPESYTIGSDMYQAFFASLGKNVFFYNRSARLIGLPVPPASLEKSADYTAPCFAEKVLAFDTSPSVKN